jgi:hypothetical protein
LKLDESPSQIRNPKSQLGLPAGSEAIRFQIKISDFGFEMGFRPISKFFVALLCIMLAAIVLHAQGRGPAPRNPKDGALIDLTGYWVAIVTEDWRFRMVTPPKGDYPNFPLNDAGKKIADAWDPAKDEAAGEQCKAYGAVNIMRIPTRLHITWADETTLKIETDAGKQTRVLHFGNPKPPAGPANWQGFSVARWEPSAGRGPGGSLKVATTRMRPGYFQKNGVPYSANASMTEYFDVVKEPNGDQWLVVKSIVEDPQYLTRSFIRSTHFRKQSDMSGWNPTPCSAR